MEIVSNLPFPDKMYIPLERLLRACLIILMSGMLYFGVQNHMESMEEEPRGDIVDAAVLRSGTGFLKTDPVNICMDAGEIMVIIPGRGIERFEVLPAPYTKSDKAEAMAPVIGKKGISAEVPKSYKAEAIAPIIGKKEIATEEPESCQPEEAVPIIKGNEMTPEDIVPNKPEEAVPIIKGNEMTPEDTVPDRPEEAVPIIKVVPDKPETAEPKIEETEITVSDPADNGTGVKVPETPDIDESDMQADDSDCSVDREVIGSTDVSEAEEDPDIHGITILSGFVLDAEGYITGTESNVDVTDGILVFPIDQVCVGIRKGALSGLGEYVYELYIPANIRDIDTGVFAELTSLMYIEVEEDNPCYYSMDGILYSVTGEVIFDPCEEI